jgi:hypothetical protein
MAADTRDEMSATASPDDRSPARLLLVQPAGWVRLLLGVPFLVVGVLLLLLFRSDPHSDSSPGLATTFVGVLIGLILTLYRRVVVLDRSRGTVEVRRWCGATWARTVRGLPAYDRVEIRRQVEGRQSESRARFTYRVFLVGRGGDLELVLDTSEVRSRRRARAVARVTGRDLVDLTEDPPVRQSAVELQLRERR